MSGTNNQTLPYGTWQSPVSAEMVASAGIDFGHVTMDGETLYWREQRPDEDGRCVVVCYCNGTYDDVTPENINVRTLVHQYGGGDFAVQDDSVFFVQLGDQRVYRQSPNSEPVAITPEPETERGLRYTDFEIADSGCHLYCVREDHDSVTSEGSVEEPVTTLVRIAADGSEEPQVVASGHDFYAAPSLSPDGSQLAWLTWDHPRMPWDGTELHVAEVNEDGGLSNERVIM